MEPIYALDCGSAGRMPDSFIPEWIRDHLPSVLPSTWRVNAWGMDGARFVSNFGLTVIISGATEQDGKRWVHLSCSHVRRMPTWPELREVKHVFLGRESLAVQVLPPESEYVNIHPNVLHMWMCLDGCPTPDFTRGGRTI